MFFREIHKQPYESVINTVEFIKLLTEVLKRFPYELSIKNWDAIRIGLSSWILSVSKSIAHFKDPKVGLKNNLFSEILSKCTSISRLLFLLWLFINCLPP